MTSLIDKIQETINIIDEQDNNANLATRIEFFNRNTSKTSSTIKSIIKRKEIRTKLIDYKLSNDNLIVSNTNRTKDYICALIEKLNDDEEDDFDSEKMKFRDFEEWVCNYDKVLKESNDSSWDSFTAFLDASDIEKIIDQNRKLASNEMNVLETKFEEIKQFINKVPLKENLENVISTINEINKIIKKYGIEKPTIVTEFLDKLNKRRFVLLNELPLPVFQWLSENDMLKDFKIQLASTK